jgi:hypothetical protein
LSQFIINKIPIRNAGPEICKHQSSLYHSIGFDIIIPIIFIPLYKSPARIKTIPPTISCFQDINKTINKINTGILCINNPSTVPQKPNFISKISKEKMAKNSIKIIDKILGVQYTDLLIFFSILSYSIKKPPKRRFFLAPGTGRC